MKLPKLPNEKRFSLTELEKIKELEISTNQFKAKFHEDMKEMFSPGVDRFEIYESKMNGNGK